MLYKYILYNKRPNILIRPNTRMTVWTTFRTKPKRGLQGPAEAVRGCEELRGPAEALNNSSSLNNNLTLLTI